MTGPAALGSSKKPKEDPYKLLAKAAPFYDFSSPELKPWHLKASYQLYDEQGKPIEKGTFEYWWASPKVYRMTWTRPGVAFSRWHTADGKHATESNGKRLDFFEKNLDSDLISPLPEEVTLNSSKMGLTFKTIKVGKFELPCIVLAPLSAQAPAHEKKSALDRWKMAAPTYCFDEGSSALVLTFTYGAITTEFGKFKKAQGRFLPFEIIEYAGKYKRLMATVSEVGGMSPNDPILAPPKDSLVADVPRISLSGSVTQGAILQRRLPEYPPLARVEGLQGVVVLVGLIGTDGKVRDLEVIDSTSPLLTDSAIKAVSHWEYKPYLLNGKPVEVETTINVIYSLGR